MVDRFCRNSLWHPTHASQEIRMRWARPWHSAERVGVLRDDGGGGASSVPVHADLLDECASEQNSEQPKLAQPHPSDVAVRIKVLHRVRLLQIRQLLVEHVEELGERNTPAAVLVHLR